MRYMPSKSLVGRWTLNRAGKGCEQTFSPLSSHTRRARSLIPVLFHPRLGCAHCGQKYNKRYYVKRRRRIRKKKRRWTPPHHRSNFTYMDLGVNAKRSSSLSLWVFVRPPLRFSLVDVYMIFIRYIPAQSSCRTFQSRGFSLFEVCLSRARLPWTFLSARGLYTCPKET